MKGKAAWVSCRETRFLPTGSLPVLLLVMAGNVTLSAGHEGNWSVGMVLALPCCWPSPGRTEGWPWSLGSILLDFAWK